MKRGTQEVRSISTKDVKGQSQDFPEATEGSGEQQETLGVVFHRRSMYINKEGGIFMRQLTYFTLPNNGKPGLALGHRFPQFS